MAAFQLPTFVKSKDSNLIASASSLRSPIDSDPAAYAQLLRACRGAESLAEGRRIHADIIAEGLEQDPCFGDSLVQMYLNCHSVKDARAAFERMDEQDVVLWTAMVAAYAQRGNSTEAFFLFRRMQLEGILPDTVTLVTVLNACASPRELSEGRRIHAWLVETGLVGSPVVQNALVKMYSKCRSLEEAKELFTTRMGSPQLAMAWNAMITVYAEHGRNQDALGLFRQMQLQGVMPNRITFLAVLNACSGSLKAGGTIHGCITESGYESNAMVATALVNMYSKCGNLQRARNVFDRMRGGRDVVSWTAMISAYAQEGHPREALKLFQEMQSEGVAPNKVTFVMLLKACASLQDLAEGKLIHSHILEMRLEADLVVATGLINVYGKCGDLVEARRVFDRMHRQRDLVMWNTMLAACAQQKGHEEEAFLLFQEMQLRGVVPDELTLLNVVTACTGMGLLAEGKLLHAQIVDSGFESDCSLQNAMISMYGKCGSLELARSVFERVPQRSVISWNAIVAVDAQYGHCSQTFRLFQMMQHEGVKPNNVTFLSVLFACSHAGLLDDGKRYFNLMATEPSLTPMVEHYGCMIDLLSRAGKLNEAEDFINKMPFPPDTVAWKALLGACRLYGDHDRGKHIAKQVLKLDSSDHTAYLTLSSICASQSG